MQPALLLADLSPHARSQLLLALAILMALVIVGFIVIVLVRRRLNADDTDTGAGVGFSLSDLRKMRDRGEITPDEYEFTRNRVIAKVKSTLDAKPPKKSPSPPPIDPDSGLPSI